MNIILDLETLGTSSNSIIVQIGAVALDSTHKQVSTFSRSISAKSISETRNNKNLAVDVPTQLWWSTQPNVAKVFSGADDYEYSLIKFCEWFRDLGDPDAKVWGRGPDFDNVILANSLLAFNILVPWKYQKSRCLRTLLDDADLNTELFKRYKTEEEHTALGDARYEARLFKAAKELLK